MWMSDYIRTIKKKFASQYHFIPSRVVNGEPCFDNIPDGEYPMTIEGRIDCVKVSGNGISCCNFAKAIKRRKSKNR